MIWLGLLLLPGIAAQDYRFPISDDHIVYAYPTAYYDQGGHDWACGSTTYSGHRGSDFGIGSFDGMYDGRDIVAAADGQVIDTHDGEYDECTTGDCSGGGGYGNYVKLQHADGHTTIYAHMAQWSVAVTNGQSVSCGDQLGQVGSSGYSTGPHLHFEVRDASGVQLDPFDGDCAAGPTQWVAQGSHGGLPAPTCDGPVEPCTPVGWLACGEGTTGRNDDPGSTDNHSFYGCETFTYVGPELAWSFATDRDEAVTLNLTGLSADLDLYALESDACDGSGCLAASSNSDASDESLTFQATAGTTYTLVIDGWEGAVSSFELDVDCDGELPTTGHDSAADTGDSPPPVDSGIPPRDSGTETSTPPGDREVVNELGGGCGCGTPTPALPPLAMLFTLLWWRTRRTETHT